MQLHFSTLGSGDGSQVDLCPSCRYNIKISYRNRPAQVAWLNGTQISETYGPDDVKVTIRGIKRCKQHNQHHHHHYSTGTGAKTKQETTPHFLNAALKSGIDIQEDADDYRSNILKQRHPNVRF